MVDINIEKAQKTPGTPYEYAYRGTPELADISFAEPLELRAEYYFLDEKQVAVQGQFTCAVTEGCTRCLKDVRVEIAHRFKEVYLPQQLRSDDNYTYEGRVLSLDQLVRDAILLSLPGKVLCGEGCRGLCPGCGQNLNEGECKCEREGDEASPFAGLKDLFREDGGGE